MDFKPQNAKGVPSVTEAVTKVAEPVMEPKLDGWRMMAYVTEDGIAVYSRTGKLYSGRLPEVEAELAKLPVGTVLDGEVVDLKTQDVTAVTNVFGKSVAKATQEQRDKLTYVAFDVLRIGNTDSTAAPLSKRHAVLGEMLERTGVDESRVVRISQLPVDEDVYQAILESGYEGVMVKDLTKPYAQGKRGHGWFKIKAVTDIDVVVMGMELDGKGQHEGKVGRFVVGQYQDGEIVERAKVNPYDDAMRDAMTEAVRFAQENGTINEFAGRVLTIKHYGTLHQNGGDQVTGLRHPVFVRWREDKPASDCTYHND